MATVLNYNQSLKALNVSRPVVFSIEEETTDHFARMLKVITDLVSMGGNAIASAVHLSVPLYLSN